MGKMFGILALVLGLWAAAEVYTQGIDSAFGGILASSETAGLGEAGDTRPQTVPQRAGSSVERHHAEANARRNKLMGE